MFRIEFDDTVTNQLENTMHHLLKSVYEVPKERMEELGDEYGEMRWVVDFTPESVANLALRKTDLDNFIYNNEGNLYNNLFYKVTVKTILFN